ncbi:MAG: hypothetical protein AAGD05_07580 [Bacteroidota bacterium]
MKVLKNLWTLCLIVALQLTALHAIQAQCGTFADSNQEDEGLEAHNLYRDAVKAGDFEGAYENWMRAYTIAPAANGKNHLHYSDGRKIMKNKFEKATDDAAKKEAVADILRLYDEQIACYGKNGQDAYLMGRKAYNLFYYYKKFVDGDADQQVFDLCKTAVEKAENKLEDIVLVPYASAVVNLFVAEKIDKAGARAVHTKLNEIADYNIANNAKSAERFKASKASMNGTFAKIEAHIFDCDYFVKKVRPDYEANPDDPEVLEATIRTLKRRGCDETEPFLAELETKYKAYAEAENARRRAEWQANNPVAVAKKLKEEGDFDGAIVKYEEAIAKAETTEEQAPYYLRIAQIEYSDKRNYSKARNLAKKAAGMKDNWGSPYLMLGDIYAKMSKGCKDDWNTRLAILAALDKYYKAKSVDPSVADDANKRIRTYSAAKPEKQEGFMRGVSAGQVVSCGCGVGESVKVSFK